MVKKKQRTFHQPMTQYDEETRVTKRRRLPDAFEMLPELEDMEPLMETIPESNILGGLVEFEVQYQNCHIAISPWLLDEMDAKLNGFGMGNLWFFREGNAVLVTADSSLLMILFVWYRLPSMRVFRDYQSFFVPVGLVKQYTGTVLELLQESGVDQNVSHIICSYVMGCVNFEGETCTPDESRVPLQPRRHTFPHVEDRYISDLMRANSRIVNYLPLDEHTHLLPARRFFFSSYLIS